MQPNKVVCANTMQALSCPLLDGTGGSECGHFLHGSFVFWFGFEADCPPKPLQTLGPGFSDDGQSRHRPHLSYKASSLGAFAYLDNWNLHDYVHVTFC